MILPCTGEDSIYSNTSTGSDVIMMSNCIYDIFFFHTVENTIGIKWNKIISFRTFSSLHFKESRL